MKKETKIAKKTGIAILLVLTVLTIFAIILISSGRTVYIS